MGSYSFRSFCGCSFCGCSKVSSSYASSPWAWGWPGGCRFGRLRSGSARSCSFISIYPRRFGPRFLDSLLAVRPALLAEALVALTKMLAPSFELVRPEREHTRSGFPRPYRVAEPVGTSYGGL